MNKLSLKNQLENYPSMPTNSMNSPQLDNNLKRKEDSSITIHQNKQIPQFGRKHDLQYRRGKNTLPTSETTLESIEDLNFKISYPPIQKSLKRMSPKQNTSVKIKKVNHRMRTKKSTTVNLPNQTEEELKVDEVTTPQEVKTSETTTDSHHDNQTIVIDSSTEFDVFMIMFLVGMYASRKYANGNSASPQESMDMENS